MHVIGYWTQKIEREIFSGITKSAHQNWAQRIACKNYMSFYFRKETYSNSVNSGNIFEFTQYWIDPKID